MKITSTGRPLRAIVVFLGIVFLGGAFISPWIYWLVQSFVAPDSWLGGQPFHRYFGRTVQVIAVLGLWPFFRALDIKSLADLGLCRPTGQWGKLAYGFGLGFVSLAVVVAAGLMLHAKGWQPNLSTLKVIGVLGNAAVGAVLVGALEEVLFRGALFGGLRRVWSWPFALGVSSAVYALVHFMGRGEGAMAVRWDSGFAMLALLLGGFAHLREIVPGFFNLALAGAILALACQRTGNLYLSIGLHAGWVFWLKTCKALTYPASDQGWLWGTWKLVDGWLALPLLLAVLGLVARRAAPKPEGNDAGSRG